MKDLLHRINRKQEEIHAWLARHEANCELPLYTSVDIRDAEFKRSVVDTNLFPAGFNNLCEHGLQEAVQAFAHAIEGRVKGCRKILIIAEEHTRNLWYLENVRILQEIITKADFDVKIATFLDAQPGRVGNANDVELKTATGKPIKIYSISRVVQDIRAGDMRPCLILMNHDLIAGIPEVLEDTRIPIYPSIRAGWHSRLKSHHFCHTFDLIKEFAEMIGADPWLFSCKFRVVDQVNIHDGEDRRRLAQAASELFAQVSMKYDEHGIQVKPFLFVKADSGTYGMGVMPIEDPSDILTLNRKQRNRLFKGKGSRTIHRYILQEGVPTIHEIDAKVGEACIYQIENRLIGGFYRYHGDKSDRESLNAKGMRFRQMCPHSSEFGECGMHTDNNIFDVYRILARIAAVAAHREIIQLEQAVST